MRLELVLVLLFLAVAAGTKHEKQNRLNRVVKDAIDFGRNLFSGSDEDDWNSDSDSDEDSEEFDRDLRRDSRRKHEHEFDSRRKHKHDLVPSHRRSKSKSQCRKPSDQEMWSPSSSSSEEFDNENENEFDQYSEEDIPRKGRKFQHRHEYDYENDNEDEKDDKCQPDFKLLRYLNQINTHLTARLLVESKQLNDDRNVVVSPISVQLALAALNQGAKQNTKMQINRLFNLGSGSSLRVPNAVAALIRSLHGQGPDQSGNKNLQIKSSVGIVLNQQSAQERFIESIKNCFDGEVKKCDFRQSSLKCREQINLWVTSQLGQKLEPILSSSSSITGNTKMIAVGTMQLKTTWGKQMRKNLKVGQGQFYPLGEKQPITVKTLDSEGDFNYYEDNQLKILGLQSQEKLLNIYVILPKTRHGLNEIERKRLQYGKQFQELLENCEARREKLKIRLPVFQIVHELDSKQILRRMGLEDLFDAERADFSGIFDSEESERLLKHREGKDKVVGGLEDIEVKPRQGRGRDHKFENQLYLNKIVQQSVIQVNENGLDWTVTKNFLSEPGKSGKAKSEDENESREHGDHDFSVDHAFSFVVKHNPSGQIVFAGRVVDVSQPVEIL